MAISPDDARKKILQRALDFLEDPLSDFALSEREAEVAVLLSQGLTQREIAEQIGIAEGTVKVVAMRIRAKTGIMTKRLPARTIKRLSMFIKEALQ